MSKQYDIIIVGASIAGLYTGMKLAGAGKKVCIIDRKKEIGLPVRCGEATGSRAELARFVPGDESWIARDITGIAIHVNDDNARTRKIPQFGVTLHRDLFEKALAAKALQHGADLVLETPIAGLLQHNGRYAGVTAEDGRDFSGRLIIGTDGCESKIGRWAGLTTVLPLADAFSSVQYRVRSDYCNDGLLHFFVGSSIVPGGYLWVFPKSDTEISIGAGMYCGNAVSPKVQELLDGFVEKKIPKAQYTNVISGCAPLSICPRMLYNNNVLVIGDAARQVNPLTAGGIMNALEAADLAVHAILNRNRDTLDNCISRAYSKVWAKTQRRQQKIFYLLKEVFLDCSDREIMLLVEKGFAVFDNGVQSDRSKPFTFPLGAFVQLFLFLFGKCSKHLNVLWR